MLLLRPRCILRRINIIVGRVIFRIRCYFHHVQCTIGDETIIRHCRVFSIENGSISIGSKSVIKNTDFYFYGKDGRIIIGDNDEFNARPEVRTKLSVKNNSIIKIDDDCLFSNSIDITTTDWHFIINEEGTVLNKEKSVYIGKHVWIGRKVTICKGVTIPDNCVIGACSVVTKPISERNVVVAGNPAMIKKRSINWC